MTALRTDSVVLSGLLWPVSEMAIAAPAALDRRTVPWLFASAFATTGPHVPELPTSLLVLVILFFCWGTILWWQGAQLPKRWLLVLSVAIYTVALAVEYRTLFGRDVGVAMLAGFMALKMLELKSRRDAHIVVILGYFLLMTHYFYSQSIPTGIWLIFSCMLLTATLIRIAGGPNSLLLPTIRYAGTLVLQALPFMLVLYLLFPRISGPLWGLPLDAFKARTGLSEAMEPGSIAELVRSGEIAFRVSFRDRVPSRSQLYWRGPVLESYDGSRWKLGPSGDPTPRIESVGGEYNYSLTLEAHNQSWILALEAPSQIPEDAKISPSLSVLAERPVNQRTRYELSAYPDYRFNVEESPQVLERNLTLPTRRNPRTLALAAQWRTESDKPEVIVAKALRMFRDDPFIYTLRPPRLGTDNIDEFLFKTKRGFCEHYSAAFVVLMRAAGIPARVVTGYQGGEANPLDGYYVIRQSDAHAWTEVWLAGKGWIRVDPTAAVSPSRIEQDFATALSGDEALPILMQINAGWLRDLRFRWEALNNAWNQYVLGYNPERQRELLSRLGLPDADWKVLGTLLAGICGPLLLGLVSWTLYHRPRVDPPRREWNKALRYLRRRQVKIAEWEAPMSLASRLEREHPNLAIAFLEVAKQYCAARYGTEASALTKLKAAVKALP